MAIIFVTLRCKWNPTPVFLNKCYLGLIKTSRYNDSVYTCGSKSTWDATDTKFPWQCQKSVFLMSWHLQGSMLKLVAEMEGVHAFPPTPWMACCQTAHHTCEPEIPVPTWDVHTSTLPHVGWASALDAGLWFGKCSPCLL